MSLQYGASSSCFYNASATTSNLSSLIGESSIFVASTGGQLVVTFGNFNLATEITFANDGSVAIAGATANNLTTEINFVSTANTVTADPFCLLVLPITLSLGEKIVKDVSSTLSIIDSTDIVEARTPITEVI